ncbi:head GIN domain-containing protein [Hymenobacter sp. H14-R3]|uniref:head GIN domain-containing protein n=1 Tax=Hymenobacter sp. H14-R3 TaxID=3046308 RepID=UPI0024B87D09|nr:head GIN domain-containing protein [Hymenobacter sp. H14-R3]MDJ0367136.1 head GIN domain-containing protein [Hymenobacter sp. H14-R3]
MKNLLLAALLWLLALVPALAQNSQVRPVAAFTAINVGTGIELVLTAGPTQRVEVSASAAEYRDRIETTVANGVLTLRYKNPDDRHNRDRTNKQLRASVTADQLQALTANSGSTVRTSGNFAAAQEFRLDVSSGAAVKADVATAALTVHQSSGSTIDLSGRAARLDLDASSGATFDGEKLYTDHCRAEASSGSSVRIAVKEDLVAEASSGGSVRYYGAPALTKRTSSGGSVSGK